jgi:TPR repeat protein
LLFEISVHAFRLPPGGGYITAWKENCMWFIIVLVIIAAVVFFFIKWNKKNKAKKLPVYADYYARKRQEFPWLDNWIKENGDPSEERAKEFLSGKDPSKLEPEEGLTLECPSCRCPHSWAMTQKEIVRRGSSGSRTTTTQRTTISGGDLGDVGAEAARRIMGDNYGDGTKVTENTTYHGVIIKKFKCLNCGHTERNEYDFSQNSHFAEYTDTYDPPFMAWGYYARSAEFNQYGNKNSEEAEELYKQATQTAGGSGISAALLKAAEMGNEEAKFDVGVAYLLGIGTAKDEAKAREFLPGKYINGDGSIDFWGLAETEYNNNNYTAALPLFETSIANGEVDEVLDVAYEYLGDMYADVTNTGFYDKEKARQWYQKALDNGSDEAKGKLKKLK